MTLDQTRPCVKYTTHWLEASVLLSTDEALVPALDVKRLGLALRTIHGSVVPLPNRCSPREYAAMIAAEYALAESPVTEPSWIAQHRAIAREVIEMNAADTGQPLTGWDEDWSCIDCGVPLEPGAPPICEECVGE